MRRTAFLAAAVLIVAVLPAMRCAAEDGPVTLAYRFKAGETVYYDVEHTTTFTTRKGLVSETARNETKTRKHYRVVDVAADGTATLELMLDRVQMSARFGEGEPQSVDSDQPDDCPPVYRSMLKTVGKPLARIRVSPAGELLEAKALLAEDVQPSVSGPAPGGSADDAGRNFLVVFPPQPVSVGGTWKDTFDVPVNVTRTLKRDVRVLRKYKLLEVKDGRARISLETAVLTPIDDPLVEAQLIQREFSGTIEFDIAKGRLVARRWNVDRTVLAPVGDDSSMHAVGERIEKLVESPQPAARPAEAGAK